MRFFYVIVIMLALSAGVSVSAQSVKSTTITNASKLPEPEPIEISVHDGRIIVANAPKGSVLEIYSVVGIKVREIEMKQSSGEYPVNIAKGYYIIRIEDTVRKIAIR